MASGPLDFSALDGDLPCRHRDGASLEAKYAAAADAVSSIGLEDTEICTILSTSPGSTDERARTDDVDEIVAGFTGHWTLRQHLAAGISAVGKDGMSVDIHGFVLLLR